MPNRFKLFILPPVSPTPPGVRAGLQGNQLGSGSMLRKFLLIASLLAAVGGLPAAELNLIPWPAQVQRRDGEFAVTDQTVVTADAAFAAEAAQLAGQLQLKTAATATANQIHLTTAGADGLGPEAYRLEAGPAGVTLRAATAAGVFYGGQTLRQLLDARAQTIPGVQIEDAPRYAWRGVLLDVSRHYFDTATIQQLLDWMAAYKLNRFHIHLTDDQAWRLAIGKYPELTQTGARGNFTDSNAPARFFTKAEMQSLIAYAAARHIVVVPEIDMPGHAGAATRTYPELDGGRNTYHPGRAATYDFLENVLRDVVQTFPSPWIHFGGDEVNTSGWSQDAAVTEKLRAEGLQQPQQLEGYFARRMSRFITELGRTPMGWDEIVTARPATNTVVFWWRHNKPDTLQKALADGYAVVLTPRSPCYFDYPQDKTYPSFAWKLCNTPAAVYGGPKLPATIPPAQLKQILGVEGCVWTEHIGSVPYLEFMLLPRLPALAEMAWTADAQRDYAKFNARLKPWLEQYRQQGIHSYDENNPEGSLREVKTPGKISPTAQHIKAASVN